MALSSMCTTVNGQLAERDRRRAQIARRASWLGIASIVVALALAWGLSEAFRETTREAIEVLSSGDQTKIRAYLEQYNPYAPIMSVLLMVLQAVLAPIPASVVQLTNGIVWGTFIGTVLNIIGQTGGAIVAFAISRSLGKGAVEGLAGKLDKPQIEEWLERWGAKALFVIRAVPGMPSDFMSYACGLTRMPFRTYLMVTVLGYIPQSLLYAVLGDRVMHLFWWFVVGGLVFSMLLAIVTWVANTRRKTAGTNPRST